MFDPLSVNFEIRRPWPSRLRAEAAKLLGRDWEWPSLITVWHKDPCTDGSDSSCRHKGRRRGSFYICFWHWQFQVHAFQKLRRWFFERCAKCGHRFGWNEWPVATGSYQYHESCERPIPFTAWRLWRR